MREILYKAKRIDNGEWVEGFYCKWIKGKRVITYSEKEVDCIITWMSNGGMQRFEVDASTVCQYTGMTDKNGHKIWENDILVAHLDENYPEDETYEQVIWHESGFCTREKNSTDCEPLDGFDTRYFAVCGNIFDNAELLERKE